MRQFTTEAVGEGHPDKIADQISDAVLDAYLQQDHKSHVGCETFVTKEIILVGGEIKSKAVVDIPSIVRKVVHDIGYTDPAYGLDYRNIAVIDAINAQSEEIDACVEKKGKRRGAGDQGIMFGYACNESDELMPLGSVIAQNLMRRAADIRKRDKTERLRPDCKCQVTLNYEGDTPHSIKCIVLSHQHHEDVSEEEVKDFLKDNVIFPVIAETKLDIESKDNIMINPSGKFVKGGPQADAGLTGRKIICDSYGGYARHGGGAFSGKDPTKVDRSAAYMARKAAKNVVAARLASHCEIQLAYAIGHPELISCALFTYGTEKEDLSTIENAVRQVFKFDPESIIEQLDLRQPIYQKTATFGHFGRPEFSWERCDKVESLQSHI